MPPRPCIVSGCDTLTNFTRCPEHERRYQHARNADPRRQARYSGTWDRQAKQAIAAYRDTHGDVCPGWHHEPHLILPSQWACDHDLGPLCASCNGRKAALHDRPQHQAEHNTQRR